MKQYLPNPQPSKLATSCYVSARHRAIIAPSEDSFESYWYLHGVGEYDLNSPRFMNFGSSQAYSVTTFAQTCDKH
jgi:hypothetical protein